MPIRIMHVIDNLGRGGLQNGLMNLIHRLDPVRFEHVVCAVRRLDHLEAHRFAGERVRVLCIGQQKAARSQMAPLVRAIREAKPDIVHSRNWAAIEAVMATRWTGSCAAIHSEHGIDSDSVSKEPWRRVCLRRLAFEMADRVFCVSHQLKEFHSKRAGFPSARMTVIHNGVDTQRFASDPAVRAGVRAELGISEDEFCIGSVGNLTPVKDYPTLLQAAGEFAKVCKNWRLIVIGEGAELPKLEAFVNDHPDLRPRVQFLGLRNRIPALLNAMDVYVLPSISEGISNSLLEAMATGLPVAVTATGGNPEVVSDGESGLLFSVGNFGQLATKLLVLQEQRDLRLRLGQEALRRVREEFSMDSMVQQYECLYENVGPAVAMAVKATVGV